MRSQKPSEKTVLSYLATRIQARLPDIVRAAGMPASTVVGSLARLEKKGLVARAGTQAGVRGRPMATFKIRLPGPIAACQFDGTQLVGTILDTDLHAVAFQKIDLEQVEHIDQAVELLRRLLVDLEAASGLAREDLLGLALSINAVKVGNRTLMSSVLAWASDATPETFTTGLGLPVKLVTLPGVLAEYQTFSTEVPKSIVAFRVGDGISAHSLLAGKVHRGYTHQAGELGHVAVEASGPLCGCGRRGCLEAYGSGPAIVRRVLEELESGVASQLNRQAISACSPREAIEAIWTAWSAGDGYARAFMDPIFDRLGWGLGLVVNLLDPEVVVMGGYVLKDRPEWIDEIVRRSQRWILHGAVRKTRFEPSRVTPEEELRVIGCAFGNHNQAPHAHPKELAQP